MGRSAFVFDAYGTLFDVHSAVRRHAALCGPDAALLSQVWRAKQLEYTWTRSLMGRHRDFAALTAEALDFALATVGGAKPEARAALISAYDSLECYPEVADVLAGLKRAGARLAILSNGTPRMLAKAVHSAGLGGVFDDVFSVEAAGVFKTKAETYRLATEGLGMPPQAISFQSSNRWDVAGAVAFGFRANWINRTGQADEYFDLPPVRVLPDLRGLVD
jgi:2-haloacid dehalogenase